MSRMILIQAVLLLLFLIDGERGIKNRLQKCHMILNNPLVRYCGDQASKVACFPRVALEVARQ